MQWECHKCTLLNELSVAVCAVCGASKPSWTCLKCSEKNHAGNTSVCVVCGNQRQNATEICNVPEACRARCSGEDDVRHGTTPFQSWSCEFCTYVNDGTCTDRRICVMCFKTTATRPGVNCIRSSAAVHDDDETVDDIGTDGQEFFEDVGEAVKKGMEVWQQCVRRCQQMKCKFTDLDFPAQSTSLYLCPGDVQHWSSPPVIRWQRPEHIKCAAGSVSTKWGVCSSPCPEDILQGAVGNCWFMSALAVLAERPDLVRNALLTHELCPEGVYVVKLCRDGRWTVVIVDDQLPCDQFDRMVYSQAKSRQLWVPLIEKAVAKLFGCYEALTAGLSIEGLSILTGVPCEVISLHEKRGAARAELAQGQLEFDLNWVKLDSCKRAGFLMGASCGQDVCKSESSEAEYTKLGLTVNHAYSVLDVHEDDGHRLMKLKNPWGHSSWTGDWSDDSPLWTPHLKDTLKPCGAANGIFWISFDQFHKYFSRVEICRIRQHWIENRVSGVFSRGVQCDDATFAWRIRTDRTTEVEVMLFGNSPRKRADDGAQRDCDVSIVVLRDGDDASGHVILGSVVAHGYRSSRRNAAGCDVILDRGSYVVLCLAFNHWTPNSDIIQRRYTMAIHSSEPLGGVEKIPLSKYFLADAVISLMLSKGEWNQVFTDDPSVRVYSLSSCWPGFVVAVDNGSCKKLLKIECDFSNSAAVTTTRGNFKTVDYILPRHRAQSPITFVHCGNVDLQDYHHINNAGQSIVWQLINVVSPVGSKGGYRAIVKYRLSQYLTKPNTDQWNSPRLTKHVSGLHEPRPGS